jgi:hypothetical protein
MSCGLSLLGAGVCQVGYGVLKDFGSRDCGERGQGRFATGTDEGVRPYICAWLRRRWTRGKPPSLRIPGRALPLPIHPFSRGRRGFLPT